MQIETSTGSVEKNKIFPPYVDNYAQNWSVSPSQTKMVLIQRCSCCSIVLNLTLISMECKPNKNQTFLHRKVGHYKTKIMKHSPTKHRVFLFLISQLQCFVLHFCRLHLCCYHLDPTVRNFVNHRNKIQKKILKNLSLGYMWLTHS